MFYLDRREDSEKEFLQAIEFRPDFVIAIVNLGRLYQSWGKIDLARARFNQALEIDPANKDAQTALASLPH